MTHGGSSTAWSWTVWLSGPNSGTAEVSGNTFHGATNTGNMGVRHLSLLSNRTVVADNTFLGAVYPTPPISPDVGIFIDGCDSDTVAERNLIVGPTNNCRTEGICVDKGSPVVRNNAIYLPEGQVSGSSQPYLHGIRVGYTTVGSTTTSPAILNNTIVLGNAHGGFGWAVGVYVYGSDDAVYSPRIENNIFYAVTAITDEREGVHVSESTFPTSLKNNCFYGMRRFYLDSLGEYLWKDNWLEEYGLYDLNTDRAFASGNVCDDPQFIDISTLDFHIPAFAAEDVRQGGLTLADVTDDLDGATRTAPYTIGALERD